jgi:KDO2-lipid IV(A) lauroyltransferase
VSWQAVLNWLNYLLVRVVICFMQAVRIETCNKICRLLAWFSYDVLEIRRATTDENLAFAFPELSASSRQKLARRMWHHIFLLACELAHVPRKIHETNWRDYVEISEEDCRRQVSLMLDDRPVVVVSGHFGNFEVGGVISGLLGFPTYSIARPLDNPLLDRFVNGFRGRTGQFILSKIGSAPQIDAIMRSGGTIALLGDQAAGPKGCWVEFFGRDASCHKAVALLSLLNQAPMILAYSMRLERPMKFRVGVKAIFDPRTDASLDTQELTQWYSEQLEAIIRTAPEQYWWLHRRWKSAPKKTSNGTARHRIDAAEQCPPARQDTPQPTPSSARENE